MKKAKLSVIIIAKDEEGDIGDCLESVQWADEIVVVVDNRTKDKTAEIAQKYTDKVFWHQLKTLGKQKQFALKKAVGDWILSLDADERVTPELKEEILKKIKSKKYDAYHAYFRPVFLGKEFRNSNVRVEGTPRLMRRGKGWFKPTKIHERLVIEGKIGVLENEILHHSHQTITEILNKFNYFSTLEAEELYQAGGKTNLLFMILAPANIFFKEFFLRKNYRNGLHGFIYAVLYAHYYLIKHLKIWELRKNERR